MALLVSGHHVGARLDGQPAWPSYTNLYEFRWKKSFSAYLSYEKLLWPESWREFTFFLFSDSRLLFLFLSILIYFEWLDTENQQLTYDLRYKV